MGGKWAYLIWNKDCRLEERQKEFNGLVFDEDGIAGVLDDETGTSLKRLKEIILDPDEKSDDSLPVAVHPALVKKLKLHQAEGIRFMYNCAFESIDRLDGDGSGCILARKTQWRTFVISIHFCTIRMIMQKQWKSQETKTRLATFPENPTAPHGRSFQFFPLQKITTAGLKVRNFQHCVKLQLKNSRLNWLKRLNLLNTRGILRKKWLLKFDFFISKPQLQLFSCNLVKQNILLTKEKLSFQIAWVSAKLCSAWLFCTRSSTTRRSANAAIGRWSLCPRTWSSTGARNSPNGFGITTMSWLWMLVNKNNSWKRHSLTKSIEDRN